MSKKLLTLLVAGVAIGGCGNGESDPAGLPADESAVRQEPWEESAFAGCELVAKDEVRAALGEAVTETEEGGYYGCRYRTDSNLVNLRVFATTSLPASSCDESQSAMPYGQSAKGRVEPVTGLGDAAVWGTSGDLLVCTKRGLLVVDLERTGAYMTQEAKKEAALLIARSALGRLDSGGQ